MGYLSDTLLEALFALPLELSEKTMAIRAFNRLLWVQNDFINRHYQS
jgi:hypothetical protein